MKNKLQLSFRIAAIALCVFFIHSVHYSQTPTSKTSPEVVKFRAKFDINNPWQLVFSPVSKLLAVQRKDGSVQIIDIADGHEQAVLPLSDKATYGLKWTRDGLRLLVVGSKSAALWDARSGKRLSALLEIRPDLWFSAFELVKLSADEKLLLNVKERDSFKSSLLEKDNYRAQVWDLETGKMRFEVKIDGYHGIALFSPDSNLLLTFSVSAAPRLWDVKTGRLFAALKPLEPLVLCEGTDALFSPDGRFVVVHEHKCGTWIWDTATGSLKTTIYADKDNIGGVLKGFTPDGKMFALAQQQLKGWSIRTAIELRDCETGALRSSLTDSKWEDWPQYVLWGNDGRTFVATSGYKYKGRIWDVSTSTLKAKIPLVLTYSRIPFDFGFKDRDELSVHPTRPVISATSNKFVRLWNAETGELMQTLENTGGRSAWSADGKLLFVSAADRKSVSVWDVIAPETVTRPRTVNTAALN